MVSACFWERVFVVFLDFLGRSPIASATMLAASSRSARFFAFACLDILGFLILVGWADSMDCLIG